MQHQIVAGTLRDAVFASHYAAPMFRMRYRVFNERLRWDVQCEGEFECDEFDDAHTLYLLATDAVGKTQGGWRLRPTTLPYMMADVPAFQPLLHGTPAPRAPRIWEISRFAVDTETSQDNRFGFNTVARDLIRATIQFAVDNQIDQYVMVVSVAVERLLRHAGLTLHRFGAPVKIGCVRSVACSLNIDAQTRHAILGEQLPDALQEAA